MAKKTTTKTARQQTQQQRTAAYDTYKRWYMQYQTNTKMEPMLSQKAFGRIYDTYRQMKIPNPARSVAMDQKAIQYRQAQALRRVIRGLQTKDPANLTEEQKRILRMASEDGKITSKSITAALKQDPKRFYQELRKQFASGPEGRAKYNQIFSPKES